MSPTRTTGTVASHSRSPLGNRFEEQLGWAGIGSTREKPQRYWKSVRRNGMLAVEDRQPSHCRVRVRGVGEWLFACCSNVHDADDHLRFTDDRSGARRGLWIQLDESVGLNQPAGARHRLHHQHQRRPRQFVVPPSPLTMRVGQVVNWHNLDSIEHTATLDGMFDSGRIPAGSAHDNAVTMGRAGYVHLSLHDPSRHGGDDHRPVISARLLRCNPARYQPISLSARTPPEQKDVARRLLVLLFQRRLPPCYRVRQRFPR